MRRILEVGFCVVAGVMLFLPSTIFLEANDITGRSTVFAKEDMVKSLDLLALSEYHFVIIFKEFLPERTEWFDSSNGTANPGQLKMQDSLPALPRNQDIRTVWRYDSFTSALVTDEGLRTLQDLGWEFQTIDDVFRVGRGNRFFDYRFGGPDIPMEMVLDPAPQSQELYIVAFMGPVVPLWLSQIQELGGSIVFAISPFSYLASLQTEVVPRLRELPYVGWIEPYHYAFRIDSSIEQQIGNASPESSPLNVSVGVVRPILLDTGELDISHYGFVSCYGTYEDRDSHMIVEGLIQATALMSLIRRPEIDWVEPMDLIIGSANSVATWIIQSNTPVERTIYGHGITGALAPRQLIAVVDTGVDVNHEMFIDPIGVNFGCVDNPNHRKVFAYCIVDGGGDNQDDNGHGTHVAGTALGDAWDGFTYGTYNEEDGNAIGSRLVVQDLHSGGTYHLPNSWYTTLQQGYDKGARIHTASLWEGERGLMTLNKYNGRTIQIDSFAWNHRDSVVLFIAGNCGIADADPVCPSGGPTNRITSLGNAKNIITVGGSFTGDSAESVLGLSSRGPSVDGRLKPTLLVPGTAWSAEAGDPDDYVSMVGTSQAAPAVAGAAALVRQYYIDGWYPAGSPMPENGFNPSAALVRATLIAGSVEMTGESAYGHPYNGMSYPSNDQGWGRVLLDDVLYFEGEHGRLLAADEPIGLESGQYEEYAVQVSGPLKTVLVWPDPPGTQDCNPCLRNNLDLEVIDPFGNVYLGNNFGGRNKAESQLGGARDGRNVEEVVYRLNPERGIWKIRVRAMNVVSGQAPFALVISGISNEVRMTDTPEPSSDVSIATDSAGNTHLVWIETNDLWNHPVYYARLDAYGRFTDGPRQFSAADAFGPVVTTYGMTVFLFFAVQCQQPPTAVAFCIQAWYNVGAGFVLFGHSGYVYNSNELLLYPYDLANPIHVDIDSSGRIHLVWLCIEETIVGGTVMKKESIYYSRFESGRWSANWGVYYEDLYPHPGANQLNRIRWPKIAKGSGTNMHIIFSYDPTPETPGGTAYIKYRRSICDGYGGWLDVFDVSTTSYGARENTLESDEDDNWVHVAWNDFDVFYRRNSANGEQTSWMSTTVIAGGVESQVYPAFHIDSWGYLHLGYADGAFGNREVMYKVSLNDGSDWNDARRVSRASGTSRNPVLAANNRGEISYAWYDDRNGNEEIYFAELYPEQRVTYQTKHSSIPSVATDALGQTHLVWLDERQNEPDVYYARYDADGEQTAMMDITDGMDDALSNDQFSPIVVSSGSKVYVFYATVCTLTTSSITYCIRARTSTDYGETWVTQSFNGVWAHVYENHNSQVASLDRTNVIHAEAGSLDRVHVAWTSVDVFGSSTSEALRYAYYSIDGSGIGHWNNPVNIRIEPTYSTPSPSQINHMRWPRVSQGSPSGASDVYLHVIVSYDDSPPTSSTTYIKHMRSSNSGSSWSTWQTIGLTETYARENDLVASRQNGGVYAAWHDWHSDTSSFDIHLASSTDNGLIWLTGRIVATNAEERWPAVALDPLGDLHLVFVDKSTGNDELVLLSASNPTGLPPIWDSHRTITMSVAGTNGGRRTPDLTTFIHGSLAIAWFDTWGSSSSYYEIWWTRVL
jgi:hypothetical protein